MNTHEIIINVPPTYQINPPMSWREESLKALSEAVVLAYFGYKFWLYLRLLDTSKKTKKGKTKNV